MKYGVFSPGSSLGPLELWMTLGHKYVRADLFIDCPFVKTDLLLLNYYK